MLEPGNARSPLPAAVVQRTCEQATNGGPSKTRYFTHTEWRLLMAKGYWIGRVDVKNEEGYKPYAAANPAIFKKFGGRFLVRGGKFDVAEGNSRTRNVVIEFPDYASALACYRSPEYQENIKVRLPHSTIELIVIEGYDDPQP